MDILVYVIVVLFTYALIRSTFSILGFSKPKNLPPGPTSLPVIGNLHLLGNQPHRSLAKLAQTHGPAMFLKLGQKTTLVITSAVAAKEVLQKQDLAFYNRHIPDALHAHKFSEYSMTVLPVGTQWRFLRKIVHTNIFSDKSLEANKQIRDQKVKELIAFCQKACMSKNYVDIGGATFTTSLNLISNTLFSKDFIDSYEEDSSKEFRDAVTNILVDFGKPNLVDFFPVLKKMDPQGIRRRMTRHFGKILSILEELIEDRLAVRRSVHDDVLEVCLKISQDNPEEFNLPRIKFLMLDMFIGGTDTTSITIEWAMTELLCNPDVMAKSKEELEHVIGKGKNIKDHDLSRLPYLSCIVNETLRLHPPVPLLIPRNVENPVKLCGYIIPKDTQVLVNAWAIGQDPTIWEDSKEFKPERFLTRQIDVRGQDFELIPFGAGRRICPGYPLALRTIPIILGSLVNNFDWNLDVNLQPKELDMTERFGISLHKANPLCLIPMPLK